jgi:hypothetical protein
VAKKPKEKSARDLTLESADALLRETFDVALADYEADTGVTVPPEVEADTERLFESATATFREILIGQALLRAVDADAEIHLVRKDQGSTVTGRTITEQIVTPYMQAQSVPVLKNPFLSAGRGALRLEPGGESRTYRDKEAFNRLVSVITYLRAPDREAAKGYLRYLLKRFIVLRESANIPLTEVPRLSLEQYATITVELLKIPSGGRMPALVGVALLQTISDVFGLHWELEWQGINVSDKSSGAVGDITVRSGGAIILGLEVTERPVGEARVADTFSAKIGPNMLADYLFVLTREPNDDARAVARRLFSMGHEVNFVRIDEWTRNVLSTVGPAGRSIFQGRIRALLSAGGVPNVLKVGWNQAVSAAVAI